MRIGDNILNPYGQSPQLRRPSAVQEPAAVEPAKAPQQSAVTPNAERVSPIGEGQKPQLLQSYLQQQGVSRESAGGYRQQQALDAYGQHSQQGERAQLHEMLGVDEYV